MLAENCRNDGAMAARENGMPTEQDKQYMRLAIRLMREAGVVDRTGGPFGAVIVLDGRVLAVAGNRVLQDSDPTAHAEMNAIRQASRVLGTHDLSGAVLYTSCECCPMCYAAAYWARIGKIYYAAAWHDYNDLFDDEAIGRDTGLPYAERLLKPEPLLRDEAREVWAEFRALPDGARY
ncbi:MAG: nucleoside deaminase [Methylotetracoccus sp.]